MARFKIECFKYIILNKTKKQFKLKHIQIVFFLNCTVYQMFHSEINTVDILGIELTIKNCDVIKTLFILFKIKFL